MMSLVPRGPDIYWEDNCVDGHQYSLNLNNILLKFLYNNGWLYFVEGCCRLFDVLLGVAQWSVLLCKILKTSVCGLPS